MDSEGDDKKTPSIAPIRKPLRNNILYLFILISFSR